MTQAADVVAYLRSRYSADGLSRARLRRMAYLADWKSSIERRRQMTDLAWTFGDSGPTCPEAGRLVEEELSGSQQPFFACYHSLTAEDRRLMRFVVGSVMDKDYPEVEKLMYSTFPIFTQERYLARRRGHCHQGQNV